MSQPTEASEKNVRWRLWLLLGCSAFFWVALLSRLQPVWQTHAHYEFGWAVPVLAALLFVERLRSCPEKTAASKTVSLLIFSAACLALYIPGRLALEVFPAWRPALWCVALAACGLSLGVLNAHFGKTTARHFAFPVFFMLAAVPWPSAIEEPLLQSLLHAVATTATSLLTTLGVAVAQRGAVLDIGTGLIGIDEACSGLHSLQGALMAALFLGEWFRLKTLRRCALVVAGVVFAIATNLVRSLWLVYTATTQGFDAVRTSHDSAAWTSLAVCVAGLWIVSWFLRNKNTPSLASETPAAVFAGKRTSYGALASFLISGFFAAEILVRVWFSPAAAKISEPLWQANWPRTEKQFRTLSIAPEVQKILRFSQGNAAAWRDAEGAVIVAHYLRWDSAAAGEALQAVSHRPDICLPAAGCLLRERMGAVAVKTDAHTLHFEGYVFEESRRPLYVFHLVEDGAGNSLSSGSALSERLRLIAQRRPFSGNNVLHISLRGPKNEAAARAALERVLSASIRSKN